MENWRTGGKTSLPRQWVVAGEENLRAEPTRKRPFASRLGIRLRVSESESGEGEAAPLAERVTG